MEGVTRRCGEKEVNNKTVTRLSSFVETGLIKVNGVNGG